MSNLKKENKILDATIAVVSGILTELLYSEISISYYEKRIINKVETFVEISQTPFFIKLLIIISLFLAIWILLSIILPRIIYKIQSMRHKRKPTYNNREVISIFNDTKREVQNIAFVFNNGFSKISFGLLYSDDIAICINKLHAIFCSNSRIQKKTIETVFRNSASISSKGNLISKYELVSLICVLEKLFNECMQENNCEPNHRSLFREDVSELQKKIEELKQI